MKQLSVNLFFRVFNKKLPPLQSSRTDSQIDLKCFVFFLRMLPVCVFDFEDEDGLEAIKRETESGERRQ